MITVLLFLFLDHFINQITKLSNLCKFKADKFESIF